MGYGYLFVWDYPSLVIRTLVTWYELILLLPCQETTGSPRNMPERATESIKPPAAAAIKEMLSFTQNSQ